MEGPGLFPQRLQGTQYGSLAGCVNQVQLNVVVVVGGLLKMVGGSGSLGTGAPTSHLVTTNTAAATCPLLPRRDPNMQQPAGI